MTQRYFSRALLSGDTIRLDGAEAHHLIHVMRAGRGDRVVLFDGTGNEAEAEIETLDRHQVALRIVALRRVDREPAIEVTLGVALPKGERQRWLVEKAVELGVHRLVPLVTERSVARPQDKTLDRLRRAVIEASKQCGRNRLMEIAAAQPLGDYVAAADPSAPRWVAHPDACDAPSSGRPETSNQDGVAAAAGPVFLIVGPEGGLTEAEVALAATSGWQTVDLGPRILRVETAALVLVALAVQAVSMPGTKS